MITDMERLLVAVATALRSIPVRYAVGGSVASTHHGEPRMTNDLDVLVELRSAQVETFRAAFGEDWYVPDLGLTEAVRTARSFNLIHLTWMDKVDFFVAGDGPLDVKTLECAVDVRIGGTEVSFASAEDIVLRKLDRLRQSGGVFERQRRDVLGVLKTMGSTMDLRYLREMAGLLTLAEPVESCLRDAAWLLGALRSRSPPTGAEIRASLPQTRDTALLSRRPDAAVLKMCRPRFRVIDTSRSCHTGCGVTP